MALGKPLLRQRGQTLIEFALIFPLIIVLLAAIVDFSIAFDRRITLQHAVREGARFAAIETDSDAISQRTAVQAQGLVGEGNVCVDYAAGTSAGDQVTVSAKFDYHLAFIGPVLGLFGVFGFDDKVSLDPSGTARIEAGGASRVPKSCLPTDQLPVPTVLPP